jgi:hypothetical protein
MSMVLRRPIKESHRIKKVSRDETWELEKMVHKVCGSKISKNLPCRVNEEPPPMSDHFRCSSLVGTHGLKVIESQIGWSFRLPDGKA